MTCEEYRKTVATIIPTKVTRAVRASMHKHWLGCQACRDFLHAEIEAFGRITGPETDEIRRMTQRDVEDPEFRDTIDPQ